MGLSDQQLQYEQTQEQWYLYQDQDLNWISTQNRKTEMELDQLIKSSGSKYLKKEDVGTEGLDLTIAGFEEVNLAQEGEKADRKIIAKFQEDVKPLVMNITNREMLKILLGTTTEAVIGKTINVYNDPTISFAGKITGGLRLRKSGATPSSAPDDVPPFAPPPDDDQF